MKTNKDLVFTISVIIWLVINISTVLLFSSDYIWLSNLVCILLFSILTIYKVRNKRFSNWLENNIKNGKDNI